MLVWWNRKMSFHCLCWDYTFEVFLLFFRKMTVIMRDLKETLKCYHEKLQTIPWPLKVAGKKLFAIHNACQSLKVVQLSWGRRRSKHVIKDFSSKSLQDSPSDVWGSYSLCFKKIASRRLREKFLKLWWKFCSLHNLKQKQKSLNIKDGKVCTIKFCGVWKAKEFPKLPEATKYSWVWNCCLDVWKWVICVVNIAKVSHQKRIESWKLRKIPFFNFNFFKT